MVSAMSHPVILKSRNQNHSGEESEGVDFKLNCCQGLTLSSQRDGLGHVSVIDVFLVLHWAKYSLSIPEGISPSGWFQALPTN